ncbi:MAG: hypothetical protein GF344_14220 [Chitinivibrionales bacterium]|nr:hypothetical protein [Chitinivibrionales bacterium]MBD3357884.1 hypothetical protein [Chitinivibrionales bacterium]
MSMLLHLLFPEIYWDRVFSGREAIVRKSGMLLIGMLFFGAGADVFTYKTRTPIHVTTLFFLDSLNGYGAAQNWIGKTTDGGKTWERQYNSGYGSRRFQEIQFISADTGFCMGEKGDFYYTFNGGERWQGHKIGLVDDFAEKDMHFFDSQIGLIVEKQNGVAIRTTDGGVSWHTIAFPESTINYVSNMDFVSDSVGYISVNGENLYRTTDQGETWHSLCTDLFFRMTWIDFYNDTIGWYRSGDDLHHTQDGGQSWSCVKRDLNFYDFVLLTPDTGIGVSDAGHIYMTYDAGESWHLKEKLNATGHSVNPAIFSLERGRHIWISIKSYEVNYSNDFGETFSPFYNPRDVPMRTMSFVNPSTCIIAGNDGVSAISTDSAKTFSYTRNDSIGVYEKIDFVSSGIGYAYADGKLLKTEDGGAHWRTLIDSVSFKALETFGNDTVVFCSGRSVYVSFDHGETFVSNSYEPILSYAGGVSIVRPSLIYAAHYEDFIMSDDFGATWRNRGPLPMGIEFDEGGLLQFVDSVTGFLADRSDHYRTNDGGLSWETIGISSGRASIEMISEQSGLLFCSSRRTYYRTTDSGITWKKRKCDMEYLSPYSFKMLTPDFGFGIFDGVNFMYYRRSLAAESSSLQDLYFLSDTITVPYTAIGIDSVVYSLVGAPNDSLFPLDTFECDDEHQKVIAVRTGEYKVRVADIDDPAYYQETKVFTIRGNSPPSWSLGALTDSVYFFQDSQNIVITLDSAAIDPDDDSIFYTIEDTLSFASLRNDSLVVATDAVMIEDSIEIRASDSYGLYSSKMLYFRHISLHARTDEGSLRRQTLSARWNSNGKIIALTIPMPKKNVITLDVFTVTGRKCFSYSRMLNRGNHCIHVPVSLSAGKYFVSMDNGQSQKRETMLILK